MRPVFADELQGGGQNRVPYLPAMCLDSFGYSLGTPQLYDMTWPET